MNSATQDPAPPQEEAAADVIRRRLDPHLLTRGRVVFIGLGGIGLFLVRAVTAFLAGLRSALAPEEEITVLLIDGKDYSQRHLYRLDVPDFANKAKAAAEELLERHDCPGLNVRYLAEFVTAENVHQAVQEGDCVLMGVDNHATRNLVSRHCASGRLRNVVLISAGNDGVEAGRRGTYGNVQVYVREDGVNRTAPLHHYHPEIANPADKSPAELGCDESGAPQLTVTNHFAAAMAAAALLRLITPSTNDRPYDEVSFDVYEGAAQPHWLTQQPDEEKPEAKPKTRKPR